MENLVRGLGGVKETLDDLYGYGYLEAAKKVFVDNG